MEPVVKFLFNFPYKPMCTCEFQNAISIKSLSESLSFIITPSTMYYTLTSVCWVLQPKASGCHENGSDGYCYDNHGAGYEGGQPFILCGGMKFNCTSSPCDDWDGSKMKMFWVMESVAPKYCQDCEGKSFHQTMRWPMSTLGISATPQNFDL